MDGASWPSWWPPPPPAPSAPPLPSQMDGGGGTVRHLLRPFAAQQQAAAAAPEQAVLADANPPSGSQQPPARAAPSTSSNELLAQVPGSYSTFGLAPDLKALFDKPSASNVGGLIDLTRASPLGCAASPSKYPRYGLSAVSTNQQSSLGALFMNKTANGMGAFTGEGSASDGITHGSIQFQDSNAHTLQKLPFKSTPQHYPAPVGGRIHVSCLNVGGEFFVGEAGLFGVVCLCHRLRMSVAKFCEHAGGPSEKAGEIVRVENGMSIEQWLKFCLGAGGFSADTKWDWPELACSKTSPEECRLKCFTSRNSSIGKIEFLGGYGKVTGPMNKQVYFSDLYMEGGGCTNVEKPLNKPDETNYRSVEMHEAFTKNSALLQNSAIMNLGLAKNHTARVLDPNPPSTSGSLNFKAIMGTDYNGNHLVPDYGNLLGKNFDASFRNPGLSSAGVLSNDGSACAPDLHLPHKILQDSLSNASNTELKLGQSSYHQSMTTLFPSVQSAVIEFQKPQSHVASKNRNPCPKQVTKVNKSITEHIEPPIGTGNKKQPIEVVNFRKHSEGEELTDDASKNSFISLFLSHLERNSTTEPGDDILNNNEHYLPKALDAACSSDHSKLASRQIDTRAASDNHSKLAPAIIHMKRTSEGISLPAASSGYNTQDVPHANCHEPLVHGDSLSHLLPSQSNIEVSKLCTKMSYPSNCVSCSCMGNKSHQVAHAEIGFPYSYDKMVRGQGVFVEDLCTHRCSRTCAKICENGITCSSRGSQRSFWRNDNSTLGKSTCGCCCKIQEDVSKLGFRPGHICRTHFSTNGGPVLASKPTIEGLDEACACSTLLRRSSLCSREHILQSCHACHIDGLQYKRKEEGPCCNRRCCYSVVPNCSSGCGFTKHCDLRIDQIVHTVPKDKHQLQMPTRCCTFWEDEKLTRQCLSNRFAGRNISEVPLCKDISNRVTNQPSISITEKLNNVAEPSVANGNWSKAVTEEKGAYIDSEMFKGQPKFGFSSESSSAVVTKFQKSPEFNNMPCTDKHGKHKKLCDEGSRIEKCSASSYVPTSTGCEEAVNSFPRSQLVPSRVKHKCNQISDISRLEEKEEATNSFRRSQLGSSRVKRKCNQVSEVSRQEEKDNEEPCFGPLKKTRTLRCSAKYSESDDCIRSSSQSSKKWLSQPQNEGDSFSCRMLRTKRKQPTMHLNKPMKRLHNQNKIFKGDDEQPDGKSVSLGGLNFSDKKSREENMIASDRTEHHREGSRVSVRKLPKYVSLNCIVNEHNSEDGYSGSAGIDCSLIATGIANDNRKSPKIVPLNLILKKTKRCHAAKPLCKAENIHLSGEKSSDCSMDSSDSSADEYSVDDEDCSPQAKHEMQGFKRMKTGKMIRPLISVLGEGDSLGVTDAETNQLSITASRNNEGRGWGTLRLLRSLIRGPGSDAWAVTSLTPSESATWDLSFERIKNRKARALSRIKKHEEFAKRSACYSGNDKGNAVRACEVNIRRYSGWLSSDASCCVCGISNLEPCNQLIECSKCYIKVHQGCYGVLKVPRGQWFCRPCKINARNTVCVLCGYGGGAMTRALKSKKILKSLLKGLTTRERSGKYASLGNASSECTNVRNPIVGAHGDNTISLENVTSDSWTSMNHDPSLLGPRKMQWVHMVCGLWTPGTKCPNATTMSTFDISGASPAKRNTACSMCNRNGGSFIKCRDVNCSVLFHPWCAHQRGFLQSEPEGEHNENVGFYGRCLYHGIEFSNHSNPKECLRSNNWSCARTEGFKGRKGECWSGANQKTFKEHSSEFTVSQEQINAWLRINGSKSCGRGQKEYIHYKQLKGWKHLVVYKSGIHGLGLYTSVFIPRGSMVVEYVGEIVGQRVADKRETEYQSGKRQQYKSACYFFRIDKEHIIDATRKGGIARFVNHSCQPNCVAKIISFKNQKKVVFFAERHINPGEEITYDYHFNREDECQRIPCFCKSRYCRRYLN
ncbi:hypothetical protein ACP4OV_025600 [Aristida adscensionis]